jgi:hypothetical protein
MEAIGVKGGRGEIPWYHIPEDTVQAGELEVRQLKVSAPLAYAVHLINDNMANPLFHFRITPNTHEMRINGQFWRNDYSPEHHATYFLQYVFNFDINRH